MTAKQKAQELYCSFFGYFPLSLSYQITHWSSKQCALIAVDEILSVISWNLSEDLSYWYEVKNEIQNL